MRRNRSKNHLLKSKACFVSGGIAPGDIARCGFFVSVFFVLLFGIILGAEPSRSTLQNPMEKQFNAPQTTPYPERESRFSKRSQFADDTIPQPIAQPTAEKSKPIAKSTEKPKIKQVAAAQDQETPPSVWDNPNNAVGREMTLADWGIGSSSMTQTNPTAPVSPSANPNTSINPYFNTESPSSASPANNPYTAFSAQGMDFGNNGFGGYGYYDPNTGQVFANPYHSFANNNDPTAVYSGYNNGYNNWYNNGYGNGYYGGYYGQGMLLPSYPYNASYNAYGTTTNNNNNNAENDMMGQQNSLYQTLLLQEMMLREREEAAAETAGKKESQDSDKKKKKDGEKDSPESQWTMQQLMPLQVSSPLGKTMLSGAKMLSPFCTPAGPNRGVGQPLLNRSWLDHPYYFGGFCGWISGSDLVSGMIDQKNGGTGGLIFGYNMNEYWGVESRLHFASIDIKETDTGRAVYENLYKIQNPEATFVPPLTTRSNNLSIFDVAVHYYPLGNAKWKPFFKYGLGLARESFTDTYGYKLRENTVTMPLGVGLRYWWNENLAIQADLIDNVIFSSGEAKTQNNFAFCVGLTYSFGNSNKKRPTAYWPYAPSKGSKW